MLITCCRSALREGLLGFTSRLAQLGFVVCVWQQWQLHFVGLLMGEGGIAMVLKLQVSRRTGLAL